MYIREKCSEVVSAKIQETDVVLILDVCRQSECGSLSIVMKHWDGLKARLFNMTTNTIVKCCSHNFKAVYIIIHSGS